MIEIGCPRYNPDKPLLTVAVTAQHAGKTVGLQMSFELTSDDPQAEIARHAAAVASFIHVRRES